MCLNPRYSGVNRIPMYPSKYAEEATALDDYVFGNMKSASTNLIPDLTTAADLLERLSPSPRKYEILLCCPGPDEKACQTLKPDEVVPLGYDVALVKGDGWSIVADFAFGEWAKAFLTRLNEHGLFRNRSDAEDYLRAYRDQQEPDADMPFEVVFVARVLRYGRATDSKRSKI